MTLPAMSDTTAAHDTFFQPCRTCGTTVHFVGGIEQPHEHVQHVDAVAAMTHAYWQGHDAAAAGCLQDYGTAAVQTTPEGLIFLHADPAIHITRAMLEDPEAVKFIETRYDIAEACPFDLDTFHAHLRDEAEPSHKDATIARLTGRIEGLEASHATTAEGLTRAIAYGDWAEATIERVRAYAKEREAQGRYGRTVHSARIASDLLAIVDDTENRK